MRTRCQLSGIPLRIHAASQRACAHNGSWGSKFTGPQTRLRWRVYLQKLTFRTTAPYGEFVPKAALSICSKPTRNVISRSPWAHAGSGWQSSKNARSSHAGSTRASSVCGAHRRLTTRAAPEGFPLLSRKSRPPQTRIQLKSATTQSPVSATLVRTSAQTQRLSSTGPISA
jgi:hypothetical protein